MADISVSFDIYDTEAVRILQEEDPDLLPDYSVNAGKDLAYNKKQVTNAITSGIIKGESIPKIASNLQSTMKNLNQRSAIGAARTAATSAHNAGKLSTMKELAAMGVEVQKEWVATLDDRTRESHRKLDGERRDLDERFSNGLMYPGASGSSKETWRCRCTMVSYIPEYDSEDEPRLTYSDWVNEKEESSGSLKSAAKRIKETAITPTLQEGENILESLKGTEIAYKAVKKMDSANLTEKSIIEILSSNKEAEGACASLALAYCGRIAGYRVTDFRGGISRKYFARNMRTWIKNSTVLKAAKYEGNSAYEAAEDALKGLKIGKRYLLETGRHAAIVTRTYDGKLQYLELQKEGESGWKNFKYRMSHGIVSNDTLKDRFKCNLSKRKEAILTDVENFKDLDDLQEILGYINTNSSM